MIIFQESPEGVKMLNFRKSLPSYKMKDQLLSAIARNQVFFGAEIFSTWYFELSIY